MGVSLTMSEPKTIWRYMPLVALIRLLQTKTLYLARSDLFEDTLEGQFGFSVIADHIGLSQRPQFTRMVDALKADCFLSCWYLAESESVAMWEKYGREPSSIALASRPMSVMNVANDFCTRKECYGMADRVKYENLIVRGKVDVSPLLFPFGETSTKVPKSALAFYCKGPAYTHESEWRLLIWRRNATQTAVNLPISNIATFIERILVSPRASDWIVNSVRELVQVQFGLKDISVEKSRLAAHFRA